MRSALISRDYPHGSYSMTSVCMWLRSFNTVFLTKKMKMSRDKRETSCSCRGQKRSCLTVPCLPLKDAFSLLAYSDPWSSPVGYQLDAIQREPVCSTLNSAILGGSAVALTGGRKSNTMLVGLCSAVTLQPGCESQICSDSSGGEWTD